MKKIILLVILFFSLFPAVKNSHLTLVGIQIASAQDLGFEVFASKTNDADPFEDDGAVRGSTSCGNCIWSISGGNNKAVYDKGSGNAIEDFTNLCPSNRYVVCAENDNGKVCANPVVVGVIGNSPYNISLSEDINSQQDFGVSNGKIKIVLSSDNDDNDPGDYTWSCIGAAGELGEGNGEGVYENLGAGTYYITATPNDGSGAFPGYISVTVECNNNSTAISIQSIEPTQSFGIGGVINANLETFLTPTTTITWKINPSSPRILNDGNGSFSNLPVGDYTISVKDFYGCSVSSDKITVTGCPIITVKATKIVNASIGGTNGEIDPTATGGTGNYTFTLSDGTPSDADGNFTTLAPGNYTVIATDENGCKGEQTYIITPYLTSDDLPSMKFGDGQTMNFCYSPDKNPDQYTTILTLYDQNGNVVNNNNLTWSFGGDNDINTNGKYYAGVFLSTSASYTLTLIQDGIPTFTTTANVAPCDCNGVQYGYSFWAKDDCDDHAHCYTPQINGNYMDFGEPANPSCNLESLTPNENSIIFDAGNSNDIVDITKMMNCFSQISDDGAKYQVKLCVDIPWDGHPSFVYMLNMDVGHTFLTMTKTSSDNTHSISQSFGFYPASSLKSFLTMGAQNTPGRIHNNGISGNEHLYNASLTLSNLASWQFDALISDAERFSNENYDLSNFNCTGYALAVIWNIPSQPITSVPRYVYVPPLSFISFKNCPSGLYQALETMKSKGTPNIEINVNKTATTSYGPCN